jgi:hypothetical protein
MVGPVAPNAPQRRNSKLFCGSTDIDAPWVAAWQTPRTLAQRFRPLTAFARWRRHARSKIAAMPWPPPMHIVTRA